MWYLPKYMLVNKIEETKALYLKYKALYEISMNEPSTYSANQFKYFKDMMVIHYNSLRKLRLELNELIRLRRYENVVF